MRINYEYLNDSSFLLDFAKEKNLELFIKIIVLTMQDKPIKEIQGRVLGGNINVDGNSAVRRTGSLSIFIEEKDASYMEIGGLFSLNKKISIEIGLKNSTSYYKEYPILWFPQGVFAIVNLSSSHSTSGTTIDIQIKDKMVFLNGECGGTLPASTIFDEYEEIDPATGSYVIQKPTIVQIIYELVNHFGGEQLGKIIVSDLDTRIKKVMKWNQSNYLYFYLQENNGNLSANFSLVPYRVKDSKIIQKINKDKEDEENRFKKLNEKDYTTKDWQIEQDKHNKILEDLENLYKEEEAKIKAEGKTEDDFKNMPYPYVLKNAFSTGDDIGYVYSDFYFPKELVGNAGDTVCTILDTIKNTLGNFEYFYDLNGNFIFQEIKNYLNTTQATHALKSDNANNYLIDRSKGKAVYNFKDSLIISSYSNSPQYANIKNDFIVWGLRETVEGKTLPIRYHLAIDSKPKIGNTYNVFFYDDPEAVNLENLEPIKKAGLPIKHNYPSEFPAVGEIGRIYSYYDEEAKEEKAYYWDKGKSIILDKEQVNLNPNNYPPYEEIEKDHYEDQPQEFLNTVLTLSEKDGVTIVTDITSTSSEKTEENIAKNSGEELLIERKPIDDDGDGVKPDKIIEYHSYYHPAVLKTIITNDWREELYFSGINTTRFGTDSNYYYTELSNEWCKLYNYDLSEELREEKGLAENTYTWKDEVFNNSTGLDFFLDFIDSTAEISEFSISNIGRRTHIVNDDSINCIFEPEIPDYVLIEADGDISTEMAECEKNGQNWVAILPSIYSGIVQGGTHNSAYNMIKDLLYQYTEYNGAITIQTLPMYFLEPNIRISVKDDETGIYGDYMLNSFSIPLDINGTMSLSCAKVLEKM